MCLSQVLPQAGMEHLLCTSPHSRHQGCTWEESRWKSLLSFWQCGGGGVGPRGLGGCKGQGRAVWGHYLQASEQGCICICVSVSGWMGVSTCALGDHIRVGTSGGSVGRCHPVGWEGLCAGQHMSVTMWRFGWGAMWLRLGGAEGLGFLSRWDCLRVCETC